MHLKKGKFFTAFNTRIVYFYLQFKLLLLTFIFDFDIKSGKKIPTISSEIFQISKLLLYCRSLAVQHVWCCSGLNVRIAIGKPGVNFLVQWFITCE